MKRHVRTIAAILLLGIFCGMFFGCSREDNVSAENASKVELVTYTGENQNEWAAHEMNFDFQAKKLEIKPGTIFKIEDKNGWSDALYPMAMTDDLLVLRTDSTVKPDRNYIVYEKEGYMEEYQIWNKQLSISYEPKNFCVTLKNDDDIIGTVDSMQEDGIGLHPIAFFLDDENNLVMMCERGNEETPWNEHYPVSVIASLDTKTQKFSIVKQYSYDGMFGSTLSAMKMPSRTWFSENTYADDTSKTFFWNETRSIVQINPYTGKYEIVLDEKLIEKNMPFLDAQRESYDFFTAFSVQDNVYITIFPDYNDVVGMYAALFNREGKYLGCIRCTESEVTYFNQEGKETDRIEDDTLKGLLYAPIRS